MMFENDLAAMGLGGIGGLGAGMASLLSNDLSKQLLGGDPHAMRQMAAQTQQQLAAQRQAQQGLGHIDHARLQGLIEPTTQGLWREADRHAPMTYTREDFDRLIRGIADRRQQVYPVAPRKRHRIRRLIRRMTLPYRRWRDRRRMNVNRAFKRLAGRLEDAEQRAIEKYWSEVKRGEQR